MKEIQLYLTDEGEWIEKISLVDEPAIDVDFMKFNKEKIYFANEDKKIITGAVMIPEKRMYRNTNGGCYVYFSADTVRQAAYRFLKEGKNADFNLNHKDNVNGVTVIESWVKESECDKSVALGFSDIPNGTWFISCKVDDDDVWKSIKNGDFNGFSIEGTFAFVSTDSDTEKVIAEAEEYLNSLKK